jgi:serine/threonine protein kinase
MTHGRPPRGDWLRAELAETWPAMPTEGEECLTTDEYLLLALGQLPEERRLSALDHVEACKDCQLLIAQAAGALRDADEISAKGPLRVFRAGDHIARRYRVERFVGSGGMGEIYAVRDEVLDDLVALKTVRLLTSDDHKAIRRLKSEAQLSRRIGHPHACRIYEFGEHEEPGLGTVCFFTMSLISGETLGARLRRDGPLPGAQAELVARQVLGCLAEAHGLGILHRDLKSDNIMLRSPPGTGLALDAVVMDFGLALRIGAEEASASDARAVVGSLAYMAPEQLEGEKLTAAADVYAFGVILFEMLTGQLPFRGSTGASTALKRLHQPPPAPSSANPALGRGWDDIVLRCLQRGLAERFGSAREVLAALDARPPIEPRVQRGQRTRSAAAAAGLLTLTLLVFVVAQAWWLRPQVHAHPTLAERVLLERTNEESLAQLAPAAEPPPSTSGVAEGGGPRATSLAPVESSHVPDQQQAGQQQAGQQLRQTRPKTRSMSRQRPRKPAPESPTMAPNPSGLAAKPPAPEQSPEPQQRGSAPVGPLPIDLEFPR